VKFSLFADSKRAAFILMTDDSLPLTLVVDKLDQLEKLMVRDDAELSLVLSLEDEFALVLSDERL
jgi:hypothetical protein